jgi:monoamine oxidase
MEEAFVPGDSIDASSALSIAREAASIQREIALSRSGGGGRIVGGTDRLPHALAARLGERVVYHAVVRHFAEVADGVRVVFERRGEREEMIADRLVCAIPYSVLRHLSRPRLSQEKERAIAEQRLVSVARSFVEYRERPWRRRGESGRAESDLSVGSLRDELEAQDGATGILGNYLTGTRARQSCSVDDDARIAGFIEDVERIHPGSRAQVRVGATTCWDSDPYARGAYAWFAPGELRFLDKSHAPEGRIHFAGDHTSHRPGFMHGAVASAKRVVREIARVTSR